MHRRRLGVGWTRSSISVRPLVTLTADQSGSALLKFHWVLPGQTRDLRYGLSSPADPLFPVELGDICQRHEGGHRLAGAFEIETLETLLRDAGDPTRPVVVGHDPDFSDVLAELSDASQLPMPKGALARVDIERPLRAGGGTLHWLIPPDLLKPAR